jgi:hypothetical protein
MDLILGFAFVLDVCSSYNLQVFFFLFLFLSGLSKSGVDTLKTMNT